MSDAELQRTAVRMLHDAAFLAAVYADPERALAGVSLTAEERAQLTRFDRRAWTVDVDRRTRVLRALLDEYFATVATLWHTPAAMAEAAPALDAFFSSPRFHAAIAERRSLVLVFAEHLEALVTSELGRAWLALERAIAAVRRAPRGALPVTGPVTGAVLRRAGRVRTLALPAGTLAAWEALAKDLRGRGDPIEVMLTGAGGTGYRPPLPRLEAASDAALIEHVLERSDSTASEAQPPRERAEHVLERSDSTASEAQPPRERAEHVMVERSASGAADVSVAFVGEGLHTLLASAETATPREVLTRRLMDEGLEAADARELLDELIADGLLVSS